MTTDTTAMYEFATSLAENGDTETAIEILMTTLKQCAESPSEHGDVRQIVNGITHIMRITEDFTTHEQTIANSYNLFDSFNPSSHNTLDVGNLLATVYEQSGRLDEAEYLYRKLCDRAVSAYPDDPGTAMSLNNLANILETVGKKSEAEDLYIRALGILKSCKGSPSTIALLLNNIAYLKKGNGQLDEAIHLYEEAFELIHDSDDSSDTLTSISTAFNLSRAHEESDIPLSTYWCEMGLRISEEVLESDHHLVELLNKQLKKLESFSQNAQRDISTPPPSKSNIFKTPKQPPVAHNQEVNFAAEALVKDEPAQESTKQNIFKSSSADASKTNEPTNPKKPSSSQKASAPPVKNSTTQQTIQPSKPNKAVSASQATPSSKSKFGLIGLATILGIIAGGYFLFPSENPKSNVSSSNAQATSERPTSQESITTPVAPPPSSQPTSISNLKPLIALMLQSAHDQNTSGIDLAINELASAPRPPAKDKAIGRAYNDEGLAALKLQDYPTAIKSFRSGVAEDPSSVELINNLGFALYKNGQIPDAKEQIELALMYSPKRSSAWVNLGDIYFKEGNQSKALDSYLLAYALSKNKDRIYKMVESLAENDPDSYTRVFYTQVLAALRQSRI